jgi:uncharacterized membrane protein
MIEGWLFFAILAALMFAVTEIFDKHFVDKDVKDYVGVGSVYSAPLFVIFTAIGLYRAGLNLNTETMLVGLFAGALYSINLMLYMKGVSEGEISRFIPLLSINTVFIAILSALFLGENLGLMAYIGAGMAVLGSFLISLESPLSSLNHFSSGKAVLMALSVAGIIAIRDVTIKFGSQEATLWPIILWMGPGGLLTSIIVLKISGRKGLGIIMENPRLVATGGLRSIAYIPYAVSISIGSATLASAALKLNGLFVFIAATALTYSGKMIHEQKNRRVILQKLIASLTIITGVVLMNLHA